jgi:hypothetical protein
MCKRIENVGEFYGMVMSQLAKHRLSPTEERFVGKFLR